MNLKPGDKVKFLNAKGGGVVRKIIDTRMVSIEVEGGFEIPTLISELVRIDSEQAGGRNFNESFNVSDKEGEVSDTMPAADDRMMDLPRSIIINRKSEDIFLAFVPHDQKWLITGLLDVLLINNTSCDVLYNFVQKNDDGKFTGIDYGSVFPGSTLLVGTIEREELGKWTNGYLQFLFHKNTTGDLLPPFNSEVVIKGTKFFSEASYRESPMIDGKGIVVKIMSLTTYNDGKKSVEEEKISGSGEKRKTDQEEIILHHQAAFREAEVDLHIHELLDDSSNLEKSDILDFQKAYLDRKSVA